MCLYEHACVQYTAPRLEDNFPLFRKCYLTLSYAVYSAAVLQKPSFKMSSK